MNATNTTLLIGTAAIVVGAILVSNKIKDKQTTEADILARQKADEAAAAAAAIRAAGIAKANSLQNPTSLKSKIAVIQKSLGVAIDGIIGPQTLNALKQKFPDIKNLTTDNIERLYNFIMTHPSATPSAANANIGIGVKSPTGNPVNVANNTSGIKVYVPFTSAFNI